jgi:FkbM family methyltransferase
MNLLKSFLLTSIFFLFSASSSGQDRYVIKKGDPNGINKWYMGRQIAHVMSHWGIDWLERPERQFEENSDLLLKNLNLKQGMQVADIGAGSGYYTSLMAKRIGNGKVYAVDVEPQMILFLNERIKEEKLNNVVTVLGSETSVALPSSSIDMMLLVDVYHEFSFPYEMGLSMYNALKPNGRLVLVEFRAEDETVPIKTIHKMSEAQSVKELKAVGFRLEKNISNLPWQHCMVFVKENSSK